MDSPSKFCTFLSEIAPALCGQSDWTFIIAGLFVAFVVGHFFVVWFLKEVRERWGVKPREGAQGGPLVGHFERALAFLLVLASVESTYVIILTAWMAAKLALNWKRPLPPRSRGETKKQREEKEREHRARGFSALMAGVLSLGLAVTGAAIVRCGF